MPSTVKGTVDVGGVAGQTNSSATLTACYATGNVTLEIDPIRNISGGGLVGFNGGNGLLACYATGNVTSTGSSTGYKTAPESTKVDGTYVTWENAVDAMNTALQTAGSKWRYELKGALPTLKKQ